MFTYFCTHAAHESDVIYDNACIQVIKFNNYPRARTSACPDQDGGQTQCGQKGDLSHFVGFSANLGGAIFQGGDFLKIVKCGFSVHKSLLNDMFQD